MMMQEVGAGAALNGRRASQTRRAAIGLLAAAVAVRPLPARAQGAAIRMAVVPVDTYALGYYAVDSGIFAKAGIEIELHTFATGGQITGAVAAGAIDVGLADPLQVGQAINRGVNFKYFAGGTEYTSASATTQLCVQSGGAIKSPKDIAGKTLGIFGLKSLPEYAVRAWLASQHVDPASVNFFEVPSPTMTAAIQRGTIAAGLVSEPYLSQVEANGVTPFAKVYDACARVFYNNCWFAPADWIAANVERVRRLTDAIYATSRFANTHHNETLHILAKYGKIDPTAASHMNRALWDTALAPNKIQPVLDLAARYHGLEQMLTPADFIAKGA
jgi:NitT/TauT family transport system substrate-binding protein